ncbi:MAG: radical SAM family heme chaperone HemW [Deltaproteobacteria bacterium]|jgi:oxygen-independent coproporphyrinogen-3 oxidase|nr:radical SAM family heme chaperone HemW [Deltaproteobacteria bacterium]
MSNPNPGLYVHAPFCPRRCPYCDFYSIGDLSKIPLWLEALEREVSHQAPYWTYVFDTLYLGGGSPSVLEPEHLATVKDVLGPLKISPKAEITLEANPEDVSEEKVTAWVKLGVNRLSLGVQSFQDKALSGPLGRGHRVGDVIKAMEIVNKAKLSWSLDLIFGWPGQSDLDWLNDLELAVDSGAGHISTYVLTTAPGSALANSYASGELIPVAEAEIADMFLKAGVYLRKYGFERYEVSNFARKGAYSHHNLKYWRRDNYLGLGPSAHSFDGARRMANASSVDKWAEALAQGRTALDLIEDITPEQALMESLMLRLRLAEGAPLKWIKDSERAEQLARDGYLTKVGALWKPTEKGFLAADYLARELT